MPRILSAHPRPPQEHARMTDRTVSPYETAVVRHGGFPRRTTAPTKLLVRLLDGDRLDDLLADGAALVVLGTRLQRDGDRVARHIEGALPGGAGAAQVH